MVRSTVPTVPVAPPEVRCAQKTIDPLTPAAPRANEWVEWAPPLDQKNAGVARLARKSLNWITDVLAVVETLRGVRKQEHDCLDELERKGLITQ